MPSIVRQIRRNRTTARTSKILCNVRLSKAKLNHDEKYTVGGEISHRIRLFDSLGIHKGDYVDGI
jgi:hypothetical protein